MGKLKLGTCLLAALFLLPIGCVRPISTGPSGPPAPAPTPTPAPECYPLASLTTVVIPAPALPQHYAIRSQADWDAYCAAAGANPVPPAPVDFSLEVILTYLQDTGPCYPNHSVTVDSICLHWDKVLVRENFLQPDVLYPCDPPFPPIPGPSFTVGYAYVIPRSTLPVEFHITHSGYPSPPWFPTPTPEVIVVP